MIIEVLSPGGTDRDINVKFNLYQYFGVRKYWIVSPGEQNVVVSLLQDGKYTADEEYSGPGEIPLQTLPGFTIEWEEVFR
jgi:Uma2 family endonuclease